jgi:hypothetical protein
MAGEKIPGHRYLPVLALAVLACMLAAAAAASPAAAARRSATADAGHPAGYQIVSSGSVNAPPSALDTGGSATCPDGTVVWGGGVSFVDGQDGSTLTVNTSEPDSAGWFATVNNTGTTTAQFAVDAICANKPAGYQIYSESVDNPADSQAHATALCPSPKVVLGGGTLSTSDQAAAVLTSAWPVGPAKFTGYMYNATPNDARFTVFAVCGHRPTGYTIASGNASFGPGVLLDSIGCPAGKSALDGGVKTVGHSPLVQVGGLIDEGPGGWALKMNNNTPSGQQVDLSVICAT